MKTCVFLDFNLIQFYEVKVSQVKNDFWYAEKEFFLVASVISHFLRFPNYKISEYALCGAENSFCLPIPGSNWLIF